jgi:predicted nucleic acid-binding Zn ribbon protein
MDNIKDIVKTVIGQIAEQSPDTYSKTERIWENLVGKKERKHTKVAGIKEDVLWVYVDSPAWMYHLRIQQNSILQKLKEEIPGIKQIRFKMGKTK